MCVLATDSLLGIDDFPEEIRDRAPAPAAALRAPRADGNDGFPTYHEAVVEAKRQILREALKRSGKVQTRAAKLLGITQPYMARLMKNLSVSKNEGVTHLTPPYSVFLGVSASMLPPGWSDPGDVAGVAPQPLKTELFLMMARSAPPST
jgi:hypothetical protein